MTVMDSSILFFAALMALGALVGTLLLGSFWPRDPANITGRDLKRGAIIGAVAGLAGAWLILLAQAGML
jgi:presenilin-like A22 family membrane protease